MILDLSKLHIDRAIIHQVLRQPLRAKTQDPIYSADESHLDSELRTFLKDRVVGALGSDKAYDVFFIDKDTSLICSILRQVATDPTSFMKSSRELADHLNRVQTGNSPGGLVTVLLGNLDRRQILAVLKLEREEGARLHTIDTDGRIVFDLRYIKDLILTEKTRLFKIALFPMDSMDAFGFDGKICDNQLIGSSALNRDVAFFFIRTFLECRTAGDPKIDTKNFFLAAQDFINAGVDDPILQAKYNLHLLSYMSQERNQLNPRVFAADF